jgi:hypothetical protein
LIDKSEAFPDLFCGIRLNDRHIVCYICKRQSKPFPSMREAMAELLAHDHENPLALPMRWNGE